jgi:hypothetical protein
MIERLDGRRVADAGLAEIRGGMRVNGLDLSFGMEIRTAAAGRFEVVSELTMNDSGRLIALGSHATPLQGAPSPPLTSSITGTGGGAFSARASDGMGLEVMHRLVDNSTATIIANRMNGVTVNQTTTMNVGVLNATTFASRFAALARANALARDSAQRRR